jgi:hypothetical protein
MQHVRYVPQGDIRAAPRVSRWHGFPCAGNRLKIEAGRFLATRLLFYRVALIYAAFSSFLTVPAALI